MFAIDFKKLLAEEKRIWKASLLSEEPKEVLVKDSTVRSAKDNDKEASSHAVDDSDINYIIAKLVFTDSIGMTSLETWTIRDMSDLYYVPDAILSSTEGNLVGLIHFSKVKWEVLRGRRLQQWGRIPSRDGRAIETSMSPWLEAIIDELMLANIFPPDKRPNNVLINEYASDEGIMHHTDGPLYYDRVVILSLNSDCIMSFKPNLTTDEIGIKSSDDIISVLLQRRSMFMFQGIWYAKHLHGIYADEEVSYVDQHGKTVNADVIKDPVNCEVRRGHRISITIRTLL